MMNSMMNDTPINVQVDPNEDTEWNDILRQHKILPPKPPSPTPFIEEAIAQARQEAFDNRLEDATLSDLSALEDSEDEAFIATYRNKRIAELAAITASSDHGIVYPIQKVDYTTDVTEASKDEKCPGVLLLMTSRSGKVESRRLEEVWHHAATKFRNVKFCQIRADMCVEGYPEENTPTVLVYRKGELVKQVVGLAEFGGDKTDLRDLEQFLVQCEVVKPNDSRLRRDGDDDDDGSDGERSRRKGGLSFSKPPPRDADSDDSWD